MDDKARETTERRIETLTTHHFDIQDKIVYYVLAITAGCIAFSINLTKDYVLSINEIPLGISIFLWGLSFYYGITQLQNKEVGIQSNLRELKLYIKNQKIPQELTEILNITSQKGAKYRNVKIGIYCPVVYFL